MQEYSRIIIEEYCRKYPKTKKVAFLSEMVTMSYAEILAYIKGEVTEE